jgi:hypothetical protein
MRIILVDIEVSSAKTEVYYCEKNVVNEEAIITKTS